MLRDVPQRDEVERGRGKGAGHVIEARLADVEVEVFAGVLGGGESGFEARNGAAGAVTQGGKEAAQIATDIEDARLGVQRAGGQDAAYLEAVDAFELAGDEPLAQRRIFSSWAELVDDIVRGVMGLHSCRSWPWVEVDKATLVAADDPILPSDTVQSIARAKESCEFRRSAKVTDDGFSL